MKIFVTSFLDYLLLAYKTRMYFCVLSLCLVTLWNSFMSPHSVLVHILGLSIYKITSSTNIAFLFLSKWMPFQVLFLIVRWYLLSLDTLFSGIKYECSRKARICFVLCLRPGIYTHL